VTDGPDELRHLGRHLPLRLNRVPLRIRQLLDTLLGPRLRFRELALRLRQLLDALLGARLRIRQLLDALLGARLRLRQLLDDGRQLQERVGQDDAPELIPPLRVVAHRL
jgi:hypothetical protein